MSAPKAYPTDELDAVAMIRAANWLAEEARLAVRGKRHAVCIPTRTAERLADALLAAVNRITATPTARPPADAPAS